MLSWPAPGDHETNLVDPHLPLFGHRTVGFLPADEFFLLAAKAQPRTGCDLVRNVSCQDTKQILLHGVAERDVEVLLCFGEVFDFEQHPDAMKLPGDK